MDAAFLLESIDEAGMNVRDLLRDIFSVEGLPHFLANDPGYIEDVFNIAVLLHRPRRLQKRVVPVWIAILRAFLEAGIPQTVRQVFYKCTTYYAVPKTESGYDRVGNHLLNMRQMDIVPYYWIADNTRWMRKPDTYDSLTAMLEEMRKTYRRAMWTQENTYVEVWLEKDALAGVLTPITSEYDVPLMVTRGYSSATFAYNAAEEIKNQVSKGKDVYIYHFGDHDPSGVDARNDLERKLSHFTDNFQFVPVAVNMQQIAAWELPARPTKQSDSRAKKWGNKPSVELDAIPANRLRDLCRNVIEQHIDTFTLDQTRKVEAEERETLATVLETLNGASPK